MAGDEKAPAEDKSEVKARGKSKAPLIVAALLLGEGVGIFALMSWIHAEPETTIAAEDDAAVIDPLNLDGDVELVICSVSAANRREGRLFAYQIEVSGLVAAEDRELLERFVEARELSIKDRIQQVIRAADPDQLNDPALESIKRQIQLELNNLLGGRELIQEILVSKMLQSRSNL